MTRIIRTLTAAAIVATAPFVAIAGPAADAAEAFFDRYRAQDVPAMIELFSPEGTVEYIPFGFSGPVEEVGPGSWGVLIDAFPDLSNEVHSITEDAAGTRAFVDVNISGTQAKDTFGIVNRGRAYDLRHMFVIEVDAAGGITHVTAFWDNADWYRQLGRTQID
ncbi:nuclear transport factor 2 family protein [Sulfitobacter sp. S190]|uniref:nuclear transport factor 2 family protein n=1 Tax=Sulfitobacter sp. S190 TaxID=2867022 RepID=UPI0021A81FEA|nr:nuclear transport factor 2 family protein [Sulfitobacter sp. S190]UWR23442.1 nuclear transport factor 2 family protein [Sulfitobacter sp. S190]